MESIPQPQTNLNPHISALWRELTKADLITHHFISDLGRPTQSQLADLTGLSRRQVRRSGRRLCELGLINVTKAGRKVIYSVKEKRTPTRPLPPVVSSRP